MGGVTVVQGIVNVGVLGAVNNFCVLGAVPTIGYYIACMVQPTYIAVRFPNQKPDCHCPTPERLSSGLVLEPRGGDEQNCNSDFGLEVRACIATSCRVRNRAEADSCYLTKNYWFPLHRV
jgi:hypothetical protein